MRTVRRKAPWLLVVAALAAGCAAPASPQSATTVAAAASALEGRVITVHRTPTCGCCGEYEAYLEGHGLEVVVEEHDNLAEVKADAGVPDDLGSCHTNELAGYAVEGHIPIEALADLLDAAPEADGIALGGMPSGAPGMPGERTEPLDVRTFSDEEDTGSFGEY